MTLSLRVGDVLIPSSRPVELRVYHIDQHRLVCLTGELGNFVFPEQELLEGIWQGTTTLRPSRRIRNHVQQKRNL